MVTNGCGDLVRIRVATQEHRLRRVVRSGKVQGQPEYFKLSADDFRYLRITIEVMATDKPLTPQERSVFSKVMLALLDRAEPIE